MANDFTKYDAYVDTIGLIEYEDEGVKQTTAPLPVRPPRTDSFSPTSFEQRPEFGDIFAQGDFSGGAGQERYHRPQRDERKYYTSEGFDISTPGKLTHLHDTAQASAQANIGDSIEITGGLPFTFKNGATQRVLKGDGTFPGTWTSEDPFVAEGAVDINDLASSGPELFAALGIRGIHKRSSAGVWSHYVDAGATGIDVVSWVKDRLICSDGVNIYEITASGALPSPMLTLQTGWTFVDIFELGRFIYACAVNTDKQQSIVYHFGPNQANSALEEKGSTSLPRGQYAYTGVGYLQSAYLGGGAVNTDGGVDPVVYQAFPTADGFLDLVKLVEEEGSGSSDLAVRALEPIGEAVVFSWSLGSGATGGARTGIAIHQLARDALAAHLKGPAGTARVDAIRFYKGRILFTVAGTGLYYEDVSKFVATATLETSIADWMNAGQKVWDTFEISHSALAAGEQIELDYATVHPDDASWTQAVLDDVDGDEGSTVTITTGGGVRSRLLAAKIISTAGTSQATAPDFYSFSIRANPSPETLEYVLTRNYRILDHDEKDDLAEEVLQDPDVVVAALEAKQNTWVTFYEPNKTWTAFVIAVTRLPLMSAVFDTALGESRKKVFVVQVQMVAR